MSAAAIRVNGERLWSWLMHSATVGATPDGGLCRLALSDADKEIRAWFSAQCATLGGTVEHDAMGSQFARFPGVDRNRPPLAMGSHLDTQPTGGRFDGILGVQAGLEVVATLCAAGVRTQHDLMVINWTNEEGARFAPAMVASGVFAGAFDLHHALAQKDSEGLTIAHELARIGAAGPVVPGTRKLAAYFELHIEQGPVLEQAGMDIGVVTGVQGMRWFDITVSGQACHAGTTPLAMRRDAMQSAAAMALEIGRIGASDPGRSLATIGRFEARPGARNTVPQDVVFSVDLRHPENSALNSMEQALRVALPPLAEQHGCRLALERIWESPPVSFAPGCVDAVRRAASCLGLRHRDIVSGAGHDAVYMARVAPTAMIFVPCEGGISHHPSESITQAQATAGGNVLLHAVLAFDAAHA
jgi:N-carbamoyl-L-amino-acid hydrolase